MVLLFVTENVIETVWYDSKMSVAVLVYVKAGKCLTLLFYVFHIDFRR